MATKARSKKRKPAKKKASKKTVTIAGTRYTRVVCKSTEAQARRAVEALHKEGFKARRDGKCVLKGGKRK